MAYTRRRYTVRKRYGTRTRKSTGYRSYGRRRFVRRIPKSPYVKTHMVKRLGAPVNHADSLPIYNIPNPASAGSGNATYVLNFNLENCTEYTDFTNLYNEYKIRAVSVSFIPQFNVSTAQESAYSSLIYSVIDVNGPENLSIPTLDDIRQYSTVRWSPYNRIHKRYFFPRSAIAGQTVLSNTVLPGRQPWISTSVPQNLYRSLYVNVANVPSLSTGEPIYKIETTYYLSFKGTK